MTTTLNEPITERLPDAVPGAAAGTLGASRKGNGEQIALALFIGIPFLAMIAAVPFAGGWGLTWRDVVIALVASMLTGHGISIGFHRYFTHGSLKATRPMRAVVAGRGHRVLVLLGQPGPGGPPAPRHLVDQLDVPHDR